MAQLLIAADSNERMCKVCDRQMKVSPSKQKSLSSSTSSTKLPTIPQICEACRKFYCRHLKSNENLVCMCGGAFFGGEDVKFDPVRSKECRLCRFERCKDALRVKSGGGADSSSISSGDLHSHRSVSDSCSSSTGTTVSPAIVTPKFEPANNAAFPAHHLPPMQSSRVDFSKIPCKVCGCSSSGIHFGVVSCEGCKGFFRRSMRGNFRLQYRCKRQAKDDAEPPLTLCAPTSNCRQCRLKRCVAAGMSQTESAIGRLNRQTRKEIDEQILRLSREKSILAEPVLRRAKRTVQFGDHDSRTPPESKKMEIKAPTTEAGSLSSSSASSSGHSSGDDTEMAQPTFAETSSGVASTGTDDVASNFPPPFEAFADSGSFSYRNPHQHQQPAGGHYSSSSGHSSDDSKLMDTDLLLEDLEDLAEVIGVDAMPDVVNADDEFALVGYQDIPISIGLTQPEDYNSLELSLSWSPQFQSILAANEYETSMWLIDRAVEAVAKLAPISEYRIVVEDDQKFELMRQRSRGMDVYLQSISQYVTNLPGNNNVNIQDRVSLFTNGFFPILIAQLSLEFDTEKQIPNHLSLDRNGAWQMAGRCNSWQFLMERYLCDAGNQLIKTVLNLKEFALLCSLLYFNAESPHVGEVDKLRAIRERYELALYHYLMESDGSQQRIDQFHDLIKFFRNSTNVFHCEIRGLPVHCEYFFEISSPLFKDFRMQFVKLTPPANCNTNVLSYHHV